MFFTPENELISKVVLGTEKNANCLYLYYFCVLQNISTYQSIMLLNHCGKVQEKKVSFNMENWFLAVFKHPSQNSLL